MKNRILNLIVLALTLVTTVVFVAIVPDRIPVHFDIHGMVDRWGSKYEMLIMPGVLLLMLLFSEFTVSRFKKNADSVTDGKEKSDAESNINVLNILIPVILVFLFLMNCLVMYQSYSQLEGVTLPEVRFEKIVAILFGALLIIMGNYMTKTRRNSALGFRHIWTVYNDVTWSKSNRFASYVMVITGLVNIVSGMIFSGIIPVIVLLGTLIASIVIIMIYAYKIYMEEKTKND